MNGRRFRIGYIDPPMYPSFTEVLRAAPGVEMLRIDAADADDQIRTALASCHGYYVQSSRDECRRALQVTAELLAGLPNLLAVVSNASGYDTIDVAACTVAGVAASNQAGGNAQAVAEHALGMILSLLKRIPEGQRALQTGQVGRRDALIGRELTGRTVGIVGIGHIGTRVARIVRAFGCAVLACDPYLDASTIAARGATKVELPELLAAAEIVTVHVPLTDETRDMFSAARFAAMRRDAVFINTARGTTYDEAALHAALQSGHLAGAGLDVWAREPPAPEHPLLQHSAVIASPHTAGVTHESRDRVARMATEALIAASEGRLPPRVLNPEVEVRFRARYAALFG